MVSITPEDKAQKFQRHLQGINQSIVNLKEEVKQRSVAIYRKAKVISARYKNATSLTLEDKIDVDFMEQVKHLYAHFRSCLSLIVQNDSEANKLAILQPLIEQHLNDIRLDQLALQANQNEIFEHIDQTLSSIGGGPSFNTSTGSINNTFLNQNTSNGNKAITPKRLNDKSTSEVAPKTRQVISNTEKLSHLQGLQHIAQ